ncbi:unnamed protein product, partial [marine sediment metagenome]
LPAESEAGNYSILINVSDGTSQDTDEFTYTINDVTYPLIDFGDGTEDNDTAFARDWIYVNVSVTEENEDTINFSLYNSSGVVNSTSYTGSTRTINWTGLTDEVYYYNVTVNDTADNSNLTETRTITLDTTIPLISLLYPQNTSYNVVQTTLNYSISDTNLDSCWYSTNNGSTNNTITCGQNITSLNSGQGSSTWIVYANDSAGNKNTSNVTFFVDSILPTISYVSPTNNSGVLVYKDYIGINVTATDDNLDIITIKLYNST